MQTKAEKLVIGFWRIPTRTHTKISVCRTEISEEKKHSVEVNLQSLSNSSYKYCVYCIKKLIRQTLKQILINGKEPCSGCLSEPLLFWLPCCVIKTVCL